MHASFPGDVLLPAASDLLPAASDLTSSHRHYRNIRRTHVLHTTGLSMGLQR
jgi:hypothetical protein